ncbi:MAG: RsbRD N-terminal domain-containing protein [Desulfovibrionaceae bacterium]
MNFEERLAKQRDDLVAKWADLIFGSYPEETRRIWKRQTDQFANPVGCAINECAAALFDLTLAWEDAQAIGENLERLVKIRAIQDFSASQAINFVFGLKKILRDEYFDELKRAGELDQLLAFEARVDNLALMAMDLYAKSRESIYEMRVKEVKSAQYNLLRRARMIVDQTAKGAEE